MSADRGDVRPPVPAEFLGAAIPPVDLDAAINALYRLGLRQREIGVCLLAEALNAAALSADWTLGRFGELGIAAGIVPGIGPVLTGGMLTTMVANVPTGGDARGVVDALVTLGMRRSLALAIERELLAGRVILIVQLGRQATAVAETLRQFGGQRIAPEGQ